MKTWTVAVMVLAYLGVALGWRRLMNAVLPRDLDVRHPSDVWESIEDVDDLDGAA